VKKEGDLNWLGKCCFSCKLSRYCMNDRDKKGPVI
jgi:hypothetical protein